MNYHELPDAQEVAERLDRIYELNGGFRSKVARNTSSGLESYLGQRVTEFKGFDPEAFGRKIVTAMIYDEATASEINERVSGPLTEIAINHGVRLITPRNGDLPSHTTLQFGDFPKETESELLLSTLHELLNPESELQQIARKLNDETVPFDKLILAGQMLYICVADPTRSESSFGSFFRLSQVRTAIGTALRNVSASIDVPSGNRTYDDILHSTVGRIMTLEENADLEGFANEAYDKVGQGLQNAPILATVGRVFVGTAYDQIMETTPELFQMN